MIRVGKYFEIFNSIVSLIPIFVMDNFFTSEFSPDMFFHNISMFFKIFPENSNSIVPIIVYWNCVDWLIPRFASARERTVFPCFSIIWPSYKYFFTQLTNFFYWIFNGEPFHSHTISFTHGNDKAQDIVWFGESHA